MVKKVLVFVFIFLLATSTSAFAETNKQVQIFDIQQGKVIKYVDMTTDVHQEARKFIKGITGVFVKYNPIPNKGYMVRIPLEPAIMVKNQWMDGLVDEVTIIFPEHGNPYLMIFDDENNSYFLTFEGNTDKLLALVHFKPKSK